MDVLGGWTRAEQRVVAPAKHAAREISHDRLGLDSEISEHFIGSPPRSLIVSESTWAQRRDMAPPALRERALTSAAVKPMDEPKARTEAWRVTVMSLGVM